MTVRQLAELSGISNPYLSQIERGLREPSEQVVEAIAQQLELSADVLHQHGGRRTNGRGRRGGARRRRRHPGKTRRCRLASAARCSRSTTRSRAASASAVTDRAAIVTGASRGIGLALAETLAAEGYRLTVSARNPDTIETVGKHLRDRGHEVQYDRGGRRGRRARSPTSLLVTGSASGVSTSSSTTPASASGRPPVSMRPSTSTSSST